ncbi:MAG: NUDIX hydrolase [Bacteroidetes bacterium]|nr:MAG: NUDIX hydrolase [Bacteroidota bacterium]
MNKYSTEKKYCYKYPRVATTVDAAVIIENRILLIKRGNEPFKDKWALPGGFVETDETLLEAAKRELEEETGVEINDLQQFRTYDAINRDPRHRTISTVFLSIDSSDRTLELNAGDDAAEALWWNINALPQLAFDHQKIVNDILFYLKV